MAIAKNPKRNLPPDADREAEAFISGVGQSPSSAPSSAPEPETDTKKKQILIRIDIDLIKRIDRAAKRLGLSRSAFIIFSAAEKARVENARSENAREDG